MKKILVIVSQGNLNHLLSNETLSAVMVLATFGHDVRVLLRESAFSLLYAHGQFDAQKHPFKLASNMVESFEFYDLFPILIEQ
ncbi:MAG: hypothetical protein Q4D05_04495, partial [Acinetobacter sp.]|nr:hypothetical protein [Acinetobacter sp.]